MKDHVAEKLNKDRSEEEKKNVIVRTFSVIAIVLFFTGIAFFKVIADRFADGNGSFVVDVVSGSGVQPSSSSQGFSGGSSGSSAGSAGKVPVYIIGAVISPGIYEIDGPVYLYKLVELAGGFAADADRESINLAFLVSGNMMIKVPTRSETSHGSSGGYSSELMVTSWQPTDPGAQGTVSKININTADIAALSTLPGIGESTAKTIIDYRTKNGPYKSIQDIMKVSGIKENRYNQIKDLITVGK